MPKKSLHASKLTFGCDLWAENFIFENENGIAVTAKGKRFSNVTANFVHHELDNFDLHDMCFQ